MSAQYFQEPKLLEFSHVPEKSNVPYIVIAGRHNEWMISNVPDNSRHNFRLTSIVPAKAHLKFAAYFHILY